jgi:hypothetical protein
MFDFLMVIPATAGPIVMPLLMGLPTGQAFQVRNSA